MHLHTIHLTTYLPLVSSDAPKVVMPATTPGYYLQGGAVACLVDSLIPYTVRFTRDGRRLGEDQLFRYTASWWRGTGSLCPVFN